MNEDKSTMYLVCMPWGKQTIPAVECECCQCRGKVAVDIKNHPMVLENRVKTICVDCVKKGRDFKPSQVGGLFGGKFYEPEEVLTFLDLAVHGRGVCKEKADISMVRIDHEFTYEQLFEKAKASGQIYYSVRTPWWTTEQNHLYRNSNGLPSDPLGGVLMQTEKPVAWLNGVKVLDGSPIIHYGKHGIRTFCLGYHGCVVVKSGLKAGYPTALYHWNEYNELIDRIAGSTPESQKPAPDVADTTRS